MAVIRHTTLTSSLGAWFWTPEFLSHCLTARSCWMTCTKQPLRRSTCLHRSMSNLIVHPSVTTASGWRGSRPRIEGVFKSSIIITVFMIWRLFIRDLAIIAIIGHWWRRRFRRGWLPIWKVGMNHQSNELMLPFNYIEEKAIKTMRRGGPFHWKLCASFWNR